MDDSVNDQHRHRLMSDEETANLESNHRLLDRQQRATEFYIIRQGEYLLLIPVSNSHFTKNMRPYIGRRRR